MAQDNRTRKKNIARRSVVVTLALVLTAGTQAGCWAEPSSSGASGTVVKREQHRNYGKSWRKYHYTITVREDSGKHDTGRVSRKVYERCQIGDRWPDCKK